MPMVLSDNVVFNKMAGGKYLIWNRYLPVPAKCNKGKAGIISDINTARFVASDLSKYNLLLENQNADRDLFV